MNDKFQKRFVDVPHELWLKITQIEELKGKWQAGITLSPQVLGRLKQSVLITSTGSSTRIEGSKLTDLEIEKMLRGISMQTFQNRDAQEVQGYYELLDNVFNSWQSLIFSESLIKHFHKELLKYADKDIRHRGEYKKQENAVEMIKTAGESVGVLFETTKAYLTPKEMNELVDWTKTALKDNKLHPLLVIGNFVVEFLQIHPFTDGNGRLSRILTNLLLLQMGYEYVPYISHEKLIEDNKPESYLSLRRTQKTLHTTKPRIDHWLSFFLDVILNQAKMAIDLLSHQNIENILSVAQLKVWEYFQKAEVATPQALSEATGVPRPTINQILNKLLSLKLIERIGQGAGTRYRIV